MIVSKASQLTVSLIAKPRLSDRHLQRAAVKVLIAMPKTKSRFVEYECERGSDDNSSDENESDCDSVVSNLIDDEEISEPEERVKLTSRDRRLAKGDLELVAEAMQPIKKSRITRASPSSSEEEDSETESLGGFIVPDSSDDSNQSVDPKEPRRESHSIAQHMRRMQHQVFVPRREPSTYLQSTTWKEPVKTHAFKEVDPLPYYEEEKKAEEPVKDAEKWSRFMKIAHTSMAAAKTAAASTKKARVASTRP